MSLTQHQTYHDVIDAITQLGWDHLDEQGCLDAAFAYYFFSIQFRENLAAARALHPADEQLQELEHGECDTDNLSPWPGVAQPGEQMHHDEFMRRSVALAPIPASKQTLFGELGAKYLEGTRGMDQTTKAMSIASYEDGGLEAVFTAMLRMPDWPNPALKAFRHFLSEHIRFDSDPDGGHGALARHLAPDDRIEPLWVSFKDLLVAFAPALVQRRTVLAAAE
jgi:hypothetical protein